MTDLRTPGIVDSPAARDAAAAALRTFGDDPRLPLGALPDEAMVALVGDPQLAGPLGPWYRGLSPEDKQLAQSAALRTMTTFDAFSAGEEQADGEREYLVAEALLGSLHLRSVDATLVAQRMTQEGPAFLSYRPVATGALLRELVSPQGYHAFLLTRPDADEGADLRRWMGVGERSRSEGTPREVGEEQLAAEDGLDFLTGITHVTTLARQLPDRNDLLVVHASADDLYVATPGEAAVTYRPGSPGDVDALWSEWAGTIAA